LYYIVGTMPCMMGYCGNCGPIIGAARTPSDCARSCCFCCCCLQYYCRRGLWRRDVGDSRNLRGKIGDRLGRNYKHQCIEAGKSGGLQWALYFVFTSCRRKNTKSFRHSVIIIISVPEQRRRRRLADRPV